VCFTLIIILPPVTEEAAPTFDLADRLLAGELAEGPL
jgi:hypothetical protein